VNQTWGKIALLGDQIMEAPTRLFIGEPLHLYQHDCACPEPIILPSDFSTSQQTLPWHITPSLQRYSLTDSHELVFSPLTGSHVLVLDSEASAILSQFERLVLLSDAQIGSPDRQSLLMWFRRYGLIVPVHRSLVPPPSESSVLTAWLHVTNECNLRCDYCYLDKTAEAMTTATGRAAVEAIFRTAVQHGFRGVKLKYAGGEALLNFRLIAELHDFGMELAQNTGLSFNETILTNGVTLTKGMLTAASDANIALSISLDGVGDTHDAQRKFTNGGGSFTHVARAIDRAIATGVKPFLSITVTGRNTAALPQVVDFAIDRGLRFNLNFYRDNDCSAGFSDLRGENELIIVGMRAAFSVIEKRMPPYRIIDNLVDRSAFHAPHGHACGAGFSYMVVDHNGAVARCQMEIERPVTSVHATDPLAEIRLYADGFQNLSAAEKEGCRDCTWRNWCAGGCSLLTYRMTRRSDVKSPYCNVYKTLFPEMLRLEGLRLLKWGSDIPI